MSLLSGRVLARPSALAVLENYYGSGTQCCRPRGECDLDSAYAGRVRPRIRFWQSVRLPILATVSDLLDATLGAQPQENVERVHE